SKTSLEAGGKPVSIPDRQTLQILMNRVQADPNSADAHIKLSRELIQVGAGAMARREAAIAVQLNPADKWALLNQGYILYFDLFGNWGTRGYDRSDALASYEQALKVDPSDAATHNLLGVTYARDENGDLFFGPDLDKAENMFRWLVMDDIA